MGSNRFRPSSAYEASDVASRLNLNCKRSSIPGNWLNGNLNTICIWIYTACPLFCGLRKSPGKYGQKHSWGSFFCRNGFNCKVAIEKEPVHLITFSGCKQVSSNLLSLYQCNDNRQHGFLSSTYLESITPLLLRWSHEWQSINGPITR